MGGLADVSVTADAAGADTEPTPGDAPAAAPADPSRPTPTAHAVAAIILVGAAVSPIVVGAVSLVGDTWLPLSDWSSQLFRTAQVGTGDTPLVGPYSVHAFAHPGPLIYWVAAPLHRLTGGDPRSLMWTAAIVNCLAVAGLAAVAWRRGRWPLLLATLLFVVLLVHGLGPERTVDIWNPHAPLLPFLLATALVLDAALGRRRALVEALVPASFAAQSHLAFVWLTVLLLVWLAAWTYRRPAALSGPVGPATGDDDLPGRDRPPWVGLTKPIAVVLGVLWSAPLLDALVGLHNPYHVAASFFPDGDTARVGPVAAVGIVGRYVRPDGPWMGGPEPTSFFSVRGSGPLPLLIAAVALGACWFVARRHRWVDVAALSSLSGVLLVGAVPATSQLVLPNVDYLCQWLKLVGALVWFTVAWTGWRLLAAHAALDARRRLGPALVAMVAVVAGAAWSWGDAATWELPGSDDAELLGDLRAGLDQGLDPERIYRVEVRGDEQNHFRGLIYWMIEDGFDVVTTDGNHGLKWGHAHQYFGDDYDRYVTVAVHHPGSISDAVADCLDRAGTRLVVGHDDLTPDERSWLDDVRLRRLVDPESLTAADEARSADLEARGFRIGIFEGRAACSRVQ